MLCLGTVAVLTVALTAATSYWLRRKLGLELWEKWVLGPTVLALILNSFATILPGALFIIWAMHDPRMIG